MAASLQTPSTPNLPTSSTSPRALSRKKSQFSSSVRFPVKEKGCLHHTLALKTLTTSLPLRFVIRNEHLRGISSPPSPVETVQRDAVLLVEAVSLPKKELVHNLIQGNHEEIKAEEETRGRDNDNHGQQRISGSAFLERVYRSVVDVLRLAWDIIVFFIQLSVIACVWSLRIVLKCPFWCLGAFFRWIGRGLWSIKTIFLG